MALVFYDHLIDWASLDKALDVLELDKESRIAYIDEIEHAVHTEVLGEIMAHLPLELHEVFLDRFHSAPHDSQHLHYLVSNGHPDVELAIQNRGNQIIAEVIIDLEIV